MTTLRRGVLLGALSAAACSPGGGPAGFTTRDASVEAAMRMIEGTARSMGVTVVD